MANAMTTVPTRSLSELQRVDSDDISPKTLPTKSEYFPPSDAHSGDGSNTSVRASEGEDDVDIDGSSARKSSISFVHDLPHPRNESIGSANRVSSSDDARRDSMARKSSTGSVSFRPPRNPSLPQGTPQQWSATRIRASSPPPERFQNHVAFDNLPIGEPTKNNTPSFTLNVKHRGYQARRRSRTFMVGVDEHSYSDYALQWLLDELVDDGDEIICVRVIEKEIRGLDKQYQDEAQNVMQRILTKNGANRAVSIVLEYAVGKLHATFQKMIQMYQPAMLIVGTRGRSLGGIQGLVNTRNSFSKYCLQYSPVPVVVVRPTEKRIKKKTKRANDNSRQTYLSMLAATHGKHEADSEASSAYELEVQISPDEEAHQVARVLGLPARFDPTIKPINPGQLFTPRASASMAHLSTESSGNESQRVTKDSRASSADSDDDDDDEDDDEGEFEVVNGQEALDQQKLEQLHKMEVGEAAALKMKVDEDEDEDEDGDGIPVQKSAS